jgi:hypothetical protein
VAIYGKLSHKLFTVTPNMNFSLYPTSSICFCDAEADGRCGEVKKNGVLS